MPEQHALTAFGEVTYRSRNVVGGLQQPNGRDILREKPITGAPQIVSSPLCTKIQSVSDRLMKHPKAIVFDLDGTLIHSAPDLQAAANVMLAGMDRDTVDLPTIISFIGNGIEVLVERCLIATGDCDAVLLQCALDRYLKAYAADMTTLTRPYPGVVAALEAFGAAGIPLGICTNKPARPARKICNLMDLTRHFEVIEGAMPGQSKKPDPQSLLRCCDLLGVRPAETLYVGDSAVDYDTARNAGVRFRLYSEGYLNHPLPDLPAADRFSSWVAHGIGVS